MKIGGNGFKSYDLTDKSLKCIYRFYELNKDELEKLMLNCKVIDFNGKDTGRKYTLAKIIDMYGFQKGISASTKKVVVNN